ncbi:MAG: mitochondrial fission ELM1 family protein [Micavibrio aeruginosavorus]|uniref:Mitochondrial fission ELM1 family protein n=1 Tax=Micavibrio aeruginosavorus TaxID=349221 RepID=A0A7T5R4A8_9BACT|nr:MAG: mitochondrial fission ELM1 family protein [Micavibrio aeruginosavorus]
MTSCWIVTEGMAGTENQCLGVAEALGVIPVVKRVGLRQPWKALCPYLGLEQSFTFSGDRLLAPWPDLLISSGRKAIAAARYIHRKSDGKTFIVHIQDPRIHSDIFDIVAVPAHDKMRAANVIVTQATPNRITPQRLTEGRQDFSDLLRGVPGPRVAVLLGGNSKSHKLTPDAMKKLAGQLRELDRLGFGLMITASRRTGEENLSLLRNEMKDSKAFLWDGRGDNPYFGFLGWADYILATADSASMISEAATTGKPVYVIPLAGGSAKFDRFYENLTTCGAIRPFEGQLQPYIYNPLQDAGLIADEIRRKMGNAG